MRGTAAAGGEPSVRARVRESLPAAASDAVRSPWVIGAAAATGAAGATLAALGGAGALGRIGGVAIGAGAALVGGIAVHALLVRRDDPAPLPPTPPAEALRIATFNIKGARGGWDGDGSDAVLRDIARFVREHDIDAMVIQEIDRDTSRSGGVDQLARLAQLAGASDAQFVANFRFQGGEYGQAVLVRNGIEIDDAASGGNDVRRVELDSPNPGDRPHVALVAPLTTPDGDRFTLLGTHLSPRDHEASRPAQLRDLQAFAREVRAGEGAGLSPVLVVGGDFNDDVATTAAGLGADALDLDHAFDRLGVPVDHEARRTIPSPVGNATGRMGTGRDIDHLFVPPGVEVLGAQVLRAPQRSGMEPVSDHYALVADVVLPPAARSN